MGGAGGIVSSVTEMLRGRILVVTLHGTNKLDFWNPLRCSEINT